MRKLIQVVRAHRRAIARWWEHYVLQEVEITSAVIVVSCDTFGLFAAHYHSLAIVHQFAATGTLIFLVAHLIRKYRERSCKR